MAWMAGATCIRDASGAYIHIRDFYKCNIAFSGRAIVCINWKTCLCYIQSLRLSRHSNRNCWNLHSINGTCIFILPSNSFATQSLIVGPTCTNAGWGHMHLSFRCRPKFTRKNHILTTVWRIVTQSTLIHLQAMPNIDLNILVPLSLI